MGHYWGLKGYLVPGSQIVGRRESERYAIRAFSIPGDPTISEPGTGLSLINTATIWETISWIGMSRAGPIKGGQPDYQGWLTSYKTAGSCQALSVRNAQLVTTLQVVIHLSFFWHSCCYYYFGNSRSQLPS